MLLDGLSPISRPSPHVLRDGHGRRFEYLRLSLTDVCNFRCAYCLPDGYRKTRGLPPELTTPEIRRLVVAFARLGLWKVRLTGGEPMARRDLLEVAATVSTVPGIRTIAMTTNGWGLADAAPALAAAGVNALNVSMDSLKPERFQAITGHDRLGDVLSGISAAQAAGIGRVKINTVLMRDRNDDEIDAMLDFVSARDLSLRFIEVMRTHDNAAFFDAHHLPGLAVEKRLEARGWTRLPRLAGAGPAVEYGHSDAKGRIGIIAPYSRDFCNSCNRLRVSARGKLHLCLFGDAGYDLRPLLQDDAQLMDLVDKIIRLTGTKPAAHMLHDGQSGGTRHLASIGG